MKPSHILQWRIAGLCKLVTFHKFVKENFQNSVLSFLTTQSTTWWYHCILIKPEWLDARRKPLKDDRTVLLIFCDSLWTGRVISFELRRYCQITPLDHQNYGKFLLQHVARQNSSFLRNHHSDSLRIHP